MHPKNTPQIPTNNCIHEQEPHQIYLYRHRGIKDLLCSSSVQLGNSKECPLGLTKTIVNSQWGGGHASNDVQPRFSQIMPCHLDQPCFLLYAM